MGGCIRTLPTEDVDRIILEKQRSRKGARGVSRDLGLPFSTVYDVLTRSGLSASDESRVQLPPLADTLPPDVERALNDAFGVPLVHDLKVPHLDWREAFREAERIKTLVGDARYGQSRAEVTIATGLPIVLVFSSDWHIGSYGTEYTKLAWHIEYLLNTPGVYLADLGDGLDNFIRFKTQLAVLNQVFPPDIQKRLYFSILGELARAGKYLFRTWSNHVEEFDERTFGGLQDFAGAELLYLKDEGLVTLHVGTTTYSISAKHKTRYNSFLNRLHGQKREFQLRHPSDIVACGHTHVSDFETYHHYGKDNLLIQAGTFKEEDVYSKRYFGLPEFGVPSVVLFPDERVMLPFKVLQDAVMFRDALIAHVPHYAAIAKEENYGPARTHLA